MWTFNYENEVVFSSDSETIVSSLLIFTEQSFGLGPYGVAGVHRDWQYSTQISTRHPLA